MAQLGLPLAGVIRLFVHASKIVGNVKTDVGRKREKLLDRVTHLFVGDIDSFHSLHQQSQMLEAELAETKQEARELEQRVVEKDNEIATLLETIKDELSHTEETTP